MLRRYWLKAVLTSAAAAAGLTACGFQIRRAPAFAFQSIFSPFPESSVLGIELRRSLESSGNVRVITDVRQMDQAQVILDVVTDRREKTVVGRNAAGQVREFQLRIRFAFKLRSRQGTELIPTTEILQQRDISFNESAVLAKETEEGLLYREMQSDIVQQIMRRLAAVTSLS